MIPKHIELKAQMHRRRLASFVASYKNPIRKSRRRILDLKDEIEIEKKKGGILSKLKLNMIFIGLEIQLTKELAWYELYSTAYEDWTKRLHEVQVILDQVEREHGRRK